MNACRPTSCSQASNCLRCQLPGPAIDASVALRSMRWCPIFIDSRAAALMNVELPVRRNTTTEKLYSAIKRAGIKGLSMAQAVELAGIPAARICPLLHNLTGRDGRIQRVYSLKVYGKRARYFDLSIPKALAQQAIKPEANAMRRAAKAVADEKNRARWERAKAKLRALRAPMVAARKAERERVRAEKLDAKRIAEQAKKEAALRKALEAEQRKKRAEATAARKAETALNNRLAQRIRGTSRGIVPVPPAPVANEDWSKAHVTVAAPKLGRYEVLDAPRMFSALPVGRYLEAA